MAETNIDHKKLHVTMWPKLRYDIYIYIYITISHVCTWQAGSTEDDLDAYDEEPAQEPEMPEPEVGASESALPTSASSPAEPPAVAAASPTAATPTPAAAEVPEGFWVASVVYMRGAFGLPCHVSTLKDIFISSKSSNETAIDLVS